MNKEGSRPFQRVEGEPSEGFRGGMRGREQLLCLHSRGKVSLRQGETCILS